MSKRLDIITEYYLSEIFEYYQIINRVVIQFTKASPFNPMKESCEFA
jgi:hypothetical protein